MAAWLCCKLGCLACLPFGCFTAVLVLGRGWGWPAHLLNVLPESLKQIICGVCKWMKYHDLVKKRKKIHHKDTESQVVKEMSTGKGQHGIKLSLTFCSCTDFIFVAKLPGTALYLHRYVFPHSLGSGCHQVVFEHTSIAQTTAGK